MQSIEQMANEILDQSVVYESHDHYYLAIKEYTRSGVIALENDSAWWRYIDFHYHETTGEKPSREFAQDLTRHIRERAKGVAHESEIFNRIGYHKGVLLYDLGGGRYVALGEGYDKPTVVTCWMAPFARKASFENQPIPDFSSETEGWGMLKALLNIPEESFEGVELWMTSAFLLCERRPILVVNGKLADLLVVELMNVMDPFHEMWHYHYSSPRSELEAVIKSCGHYMLFFGRDSIFSHEIADLLCKIAWQGTHVTHKPWDNRDAVTVTAKGLVALEGGFDESYAGDLLKQTVSVSCNSDEDIDPDAWEMKMKMLRQVAPKILGSILWAAHYGLLRKDLVELRSDSRLAEATKFAAARHEKV